MAPLYSFNGENLSVSYHINKFLNSGIAANTFLLGIPYFGINWPTVQPTDCSNIMSGTAPGENFDYWYYKSNTSGYFNTLYRDPNTFDPFFCYPDASTVWHKAFIDDVESYQKKYDLVKQRGIAGIAVWRLGQDDGYDDLWNLININLSSNNIEQPFGTIYDMGGPNGDYHTSEEYYFTISPPGAFTVTLTFDSFNLENGPDYIKIFNGPSISSPQIGNILTGNSIPSPVTANSGAMTIQFHSDGTINRPGFIANYTSVQLPPIIILNAQFNKSVYIPFEDVTLTVTLSDQLVGASVSFTVDNSVPINCPGIGNGVYEQTFPAPSTPGTHNVVVNASKTGFINATPYQTSFIVSNPTSLYLGIVTPPQGNTTTNFLFSVYFKDFQAPQYVKTIGSGWSINMTPNGSNYTEGVQFTGNKTFSTPGTYTYHYEAKTSTGEIIYFPATGNLTLNVTQSAEGWDLAVLSFGTFYSPTDVLPGTNISVTANIKNQSITGNTYTNVPLKASLLNSSGSLIAEYSTTIANLISGQSNTYNLLLTMPLNSPDGNYQIVVQVFPPQDNDPTNNSISLGLYMGPSLSNEQFEVPAGSEYIEKNNHVHIPPESPNEFKLTGGNTNGNSAIFQAPDGNLITIYEEHLELFNSYNAGIALEYFGGGPTIYYAMIKPGHSVTTGPDFPIKLIACNPGQVITFNATASNGMHFISNQEHDYPIFVTGNNTKHTNIVKTWLTDVVRANGYTTISFQFTIPSSAVTGTYKFYMTTAYSNSSIEHMTRLKIKVDPFLPHINSLDKYSFSADDLLTISGTNFGTLSGTVKFTTNLSGQIYSWSNTQIKCYVPEEIQNGVVTVANSVGTSNGIGYQVISYTGDPVVVQPIPDQSMNQNSSLVAATLTNVFWDPNNDALIFSAISSSPDITISILNGILTLTTNNNATSSAQITVSATDADNITVRDFFTITVLQIPPYPPSTLNATAVSVNQIDLSWENVSNEDGYHIYRAPTINGTFSILTSVGANVSNYADLGLSENTQFCYKITAYNSGGNSGDSPISCATTFGNQLPPVAPSFISATTVSSSQIDITWDAVPNADGYKLWSPHIGWLQVVWEIILGSDVTSYSHMELPDETEVCYYVQAFNSSGNSPDTGPACATTLNAIPIITTSVSSLPSFGEVPVGTSSAPQSYMVSGTNLTSNISITAPPGFEISLTSNSGYTNSISLIKSG
ncbi:MAG: CUB domain-containing protein, partial [Bacteroidota bacterium]